MKKLLRLLFTFCLPLVFFSCEDGLLGLRETNCLEIRQSNNNGLAIEREYSGRRVNTLRYLTNEEPSYSYQFMYGPEGRITESQYVNDKNGTLGTLEKISYNENGKWSKTTISHPNGSTNTKTAEYDHLNQIKSLTASATNSSGNVTIQYTVTYEWEGGNNTRLTYTSPTLQQVLRYEFDSSRENKRRKELEKIAFLSFSVAHNKNMVRRIMTKITTGTATTEVIGDNSYEYNEQGYPTRLTRLSTTNLGNPSTLVTDFSYNCN